MIYENPEMLVEKLKVDGWKHIHRKRTDIAVFQNKTGNKFFQVTIPLDRNLGDFEEALEIVLQEIESFEKEKENKNDKRTTKSIQGISRLVWK